MITKQKGRIGQDLTCSLESAGINWGKGRQEVRKEGREEERNGGSHLYHLEVRDGNLPDSSNPFKNNKKEVPLASTIFFFWRVIWAQDTVISSLSQLMDVHLFYNL